MCVSLPIALMSLMTGIDCISAQLLRCFSRTFDNVKSIVQKN